MGVTLEHAAALAAAACAGAPERSRRPAPSAPRPVAPTAPTAAPLSSVRRERLADNDVINCVVSRAGWSDFCIGNAVLSCSHLDDEHNSTPPRLRWLLSCVQTAGVSPPEKGLSHPCCSHHSGRAVRHTPFYLLV